MDDPGDGVVGGRRGGAQAQPSAFEDGAGEHLVAARLGDRCGLSCHRSLVDGGGALDHHAVHGGAFARPEHQEVAGADLGRRNTRLGVVADDGAFGGREIHEAADGSAGALERRGLEYGAQAEEKHDKAGLRPLPDGGRPHGRERHQDVHVDLASAEAEERGAGDEGPAARHGGGEEPSGRCRRHKARCEAAGHESAGQKGEQGPRLGQMEPSSTAGRLRGVSTSAG